MSYMKVRQVLEQRSCVDNIYVSSELVQGRLREGKKTYAFCSEILSCSPMTVLVLTIYICMYA